MEVAALGYPSFAQWDLESCCWPVLAVFTYTL